MTARTMSWIGAAGLIPAAFILLDMLLPQRGGVGEAARRSQSQDHLHNLVIGTHVYDGVWAVLPPAASIDPVSGNELHGWQTHLLPFVELKPLYDKMDFAKA